MEKSALFSRGGRVHVLSSDIVHCFTVLCWDSRGPQGEGREKHTGEAEERQPQRVPALGKDEVNWRMPLASKQAGNITLSSSKHTKKQDTNITALLLMPFLPTINCF